MALLSPDLSDDSFTAAFTPENHSWNSCIESYLIKSIEKRIACKIQHYSQYFTAVLNNSFIVQEQCIKANRTSLIVFNNLGSRINFIRN